MKGFGQRLRKRAEELGISGATVATRLGLSQQRYHNYVADVTEPDLETLVRICGALATTPNELLGTGAEKPSQEIVIFHARIMSAIQGMTPQMLRTAVAVVDAMRKEDVSATRLKSSTANG